MQSPPLRAVKRPLLRSPRSTGSDAGSETSVLVPHSVERWQFPGWGSHYELSGFDTANIGSGAGPPAPTHLLNQLQATAISGNDITSSCLYVVGLCIASAGKLAPFCLAIVAVILYLFRYVYGEAVTALPVNGGAYNVLLNTTSKAVASVAACLTLLSYVATCVVSATDAVLYVKSLDGSLPEIPLTVAVLAFFALLSFWGISDSANVALAMFVLHITTLVVLAVTSVVCIAHNGGELLTDNWHQPLPDIETNTGRLVAKGAVLAALFYGTSSALLGVSGFETSANFVEEQAPGVFVKTLRNMWWAVTVANPVLAILAMGVLPMDQLLEHQSDLLAAMGERAGGQWLKTLVAVDAGVVLCGAVLTAYVGVTGLMKRMALDRVLPALFLATNKCRGTTHYITVAFFLVAVSLVLILDGDVETLSGVYTISFLCVMALFGVGCILLKWKRKQLPRAVRSPYFVTIVAILLVILGLLGNIFRSPTTVQYFVVYAMIVAAVVVLMFKRMFLMLVLLQFVRSVLPDGPRTRRIISWLRATVTDWASTRIVFFCAHPDLYLLNKALLYVRDNEQTNRLQMVHLHPPGPEGAAAVAEFARNVRLLDSLFPKLRVDLVTVEGEFNPAAVRWVSARLKVPANCMFLACPSSKFKHNIAAFGGVRVITHRVGAPRRLVSTRAVTMTPLMRSTSDSGLNMGRTSTPNDVPGGTVVVPRDAGAGAGAGVRAGGGGPHDGGGGGGGGDDDRNGGASGSDSPASFALPGPLSVAAEVVVAPSPELGAMAASAPGRTVAFRRSVQAATPPLGPSAVLPQANHPPGAADSKRDPSDDAPGAV